LKEVWFMARLDRSASPIDAVNSFAEQAPPTAALFSGNIITGPHAMVADEHPWSEKAAD
jgi:hypothetical protein